MSSLPKASKTLTITGTLAAAGTTLTFPSNSLNFIPNKAIVRTLTYISAAANPNAFTTYEVSSILANGVMFCFVPSMSFDIGTPIFYLSANVTPNIELDLRNGAANNIAISIRDKQGANAAGFVSCSIEFLQL